jgi:hypothetical protein
VHGANSSLRPWTRGGVNHKHSSKKASRNSSVVMCLTGGCSLIPLYQLRMTVRSARLLPVPYLNCVGLGPGNGPIQRGPHIEGFNVVQRATTNSPEDARRSEAVASTRCLRRPSSNRLWRMHLVCQERRGRRMLSSFSRCKDIPRLATPSGCWWYDCARFRMQNRLTIPATSSTCSCILWRPYFAY